MSRLIKKLFVSYSSLLRVKNKRYYWEPPKKEELCKEIVNNQTYEHNKVCCRIDLHELQEKNYKILKSN